MTANILLNINLMEYCKTIGTSYCHADIGYGMLRQQDALKRLKEMEKGMRVLSRQKPRNPFGDEG